MHQNPDPNEIGDSLGSYLAIYIVGVRHNPKGLGRIDESCIGPHAAVKWQRHCNDTTNAILGAPWAVVSRTRSGIPVIVRTFDLNLSVEQLLTY